MPKRPHPLSLTPPKGICGSSLTVWSLTCTMPDSSRRAISWPRWESPVITPAVSPYREEFARLNLIFHRSWWLRLAVSRPRSEHGFKYRVMTVAQLAGRMAGAPRVPGSLPWPRGWSALFRGLAGARRCAATRSLSPQPRARSPGFSGAVSARRAPAGPRRPACPRGLNRLSTDGAGHLQVLPGCRHCGVKRGRVAVDLGHDAGADPHLVQGLGGRSRVCRRH